MACDQPEKCQFYPPILEPTTTQQVRLVRLYFVAMVMIRRLSSPPHAFSILTDLQKIFKGLQKVICQLVPLTQTDQTQLFRHGKRKNGSKHQASKKKLRVETTSLEISKSVSTKKMIHCSCGFFLSCFFLLDGLEECLHSLKKKKTNHVTKTPPRPQCMLALAWKRHWTRSQSDPQAVELQGETTGGPGVVSLKIHNQKQTSKATVL